MMVANKQIETNYEINSDKNVQRNIQNNPIINGANDCLLDSLQRRLFAPDLFKPTAEGLVLRPSCLIDEVAGVFTLKPIKKDTLLGPYVGEVLHAKDSTMCNKRFSWEIYSPENRLLHRIDATDANKSNWMRFINLTTFTNLQNFAAFQHHSQIFYKALKEIPAGDELFVGLSDVYNQDYVDRLKKKEYKNSKRKLPKDKNVKKEKKKASPEKPFKYNCDSCSFSTNIKNVYSNHLLSHISNKLYKCDLCGASFAYKHVLDFHRNTHPETYQAPKNDIVHPFNCAKCATGWETAEALESHVCVLRCDICEVIMPSLISLNNHKRIHLNHKKIDQDGHSHICEICGFESTNSRALWKHKNRRHAAEVLKCQVCEVVCDNKTSLRLHLKLHSGYTPFKCDRCEATFVIATDMCSHKCKHHTVKTFKCPVCDSAFASHGDLKAHIKRHVNEKRFKCDICDHAFNQSVLLRKHKKTHTTEKPYSCDVCGVSFGQKLSLQIHTRVHTGEKPYKCLTCGATFAYHNSLYVHKRSHTGEKPYKCVVCDAAFSQSGSLKGHMRIHTGEKPFKCSLCGSVFSQRVSLKTHICVANEFINV